MYRLSLGYKDKKVEILPFAFTMYTYHLLKSTLKMIRQLNTEASVTGNPATRPLVHTACCLTSSPRPQRNKLGDLAGPPGSVS